MDGKRSRTRQITFWTVIVLIIIILLLLLRKCNKSEEQVAPKQHTHKEQPAVIDSVLTDTTIAMLKPYTYKVKKIKPVQKTKLGQKEEQNAAEPDEKIPMTEPIIQDNEPTEPPVIARQDTTYETIDATPLIPAYVSKHHEFRIGIHAGGGYSFITQLGGISESGSIRPQYTLNEKGAFVPAIGIFGTWRYGRIGAELALDYMYIGSSLEEHRNLTGIDETTTYRFHVLAPKLLFRAFTYRDFYLGAGVGMIIPFTSRNIDFSSTRAPFFRSVDELTRMHLRETINPRIQLTPAVKIGYASSKLGLEAGLEYQFGVTDLMRTRTNSYGYNETHNNTHLLLVTLGYSIPLKK